MHPLKDWRNLSRYEKCLLGLFILTLPLMNPWVRGDGVGYYAYGRALLIEHRLDFTQDWIRANSTFRMGRVDTEDHILPDQYTRAGRLDNHFTVGPAILWSPFLLAAHLTVKTSDALGAHVAADGFSRPYIVAMACGTAVYGFLGIWLSFRIAKKFFPERWAFLATLGVWLGSSLPVYLYFNPSWSHAHSAFMVALFAWYWLRTHDERTPLQWILLGLIGGLMMDVYYPNAILLLLPALESLRAYWAHFKESSATRTSFGLMLARHTLFILALFLALLPTFLTRWIVYGNLFESGYIPVRDWHWTSPALGSVLFSADHGLFSWTPVLGLACLGLILFWLREPWFGGSLLLVFAMFYYFIASYPDWDGISSFGNRFFVSLTALFVMGLAAFFDWLGRVWQPRQVAVFAYASTALFVVWNLGLVFQWGTHLIPARGRISWRDAAYNEVVVVPSMATRTLKNYLTGRSQLMHHIEQEDLNKLKSRQAADTQ
jgi:hypothetical protein